MLHLASRIALNGEPGIFWLDVVRNYGRLADPADSRRRGRALGRGRTIRPPRAGTAGLAPTVDPTNILTRRVKQGVAEWYALDMIKRARDGFETHTDQGFNVGKPPYGYRPTQVRLDGTSNTPHPHAPGPGGPLDLLDGMDALGRGGGHRGKGRTGPRTKTRLVPDPVEADTVRRIYAWRIAERIGYQVIADRLNTDLRLNPPPSPPDLARAPDTGPPAASATSSSNPSTPATWCGTGAL